MTEPRRLFCRKSEVRAAAVASILTSGNQPLVDAALKLALEDTDPRVARQAESLRQLER